jgi:SpoVK/Ycf46/Vps4 family AAA+-type ATPase
VHPVIVFLLTDFLTDHDFSARAPIVQSMFYSISKALLAREFYVILFTMNSYAVYMSIPPARYGVLLRDIAPTIIEVLYPEKKWYSRVVGFKRVVRMSVDEIKKHLLERRLPKPTYIVDLEKDVTFKEYVFSPALKDFIRVNVVNVLKRSVETLPSILLVGPPGSGKTTLAYAIAREAGLPAYMLRLELMGSKWLGETEKNVNEALMLVNDMSPSVAVMRNIEEVFGGREAGEGESSAQVYQRVRSIIISWLASDKRRFFGVFTVSNPRRMPAHLLQDVDLGVYKIPVLPPLDKRMRRVLLITLLSKLARKYNLKFDIFKDPVSEAVDVVAEKTWAYVPRELYTIALTAVNIALDRGERELTKDIIQLAKKYVEIDRVERVNLLREVIDKIKIAGLPEDLLSEIYRFEMEVAKLLAEAQEEEAKKRSIVRLEL